MLLCPAAPLGLYSSLFTPSQYFKGSRTDIFCAVIVRAFGDKTACNISAFGEVSSVGKSFFFAIAATQ